MEAKGSWFGRKKLKEEPISKSLCVDVILQDKVELSGLLQVDFGKHVHQITALKSRTEHYFFLVFV